MTLEQELIEEITEFYERYYETEIADLAKRYPQDQTSLQVDYMDIYQYNMDLANDLLQKPRKLRNHFETALQEYSLPVDVSFDDVSIRVVNIQTQTKSLSELRDDDVGKLRAVTGQISKATAVRPRVNKAAWECQRCGTFTEIPIEKDLQEPHECQGCERSGPFKLDYPHSDVDNHQLIRVKQPPEEATNNSQIGNELDAHITGDLAGTASAGERADISGVIEVDTDENSPVLDFYFEGWGIETLEDDYRDLNIEDHKATLEELTEEKNPFIQVANSIAPGITGGRSVDIETPWGETYDKYWWVRLATGMANLFGSWRRPNNDGTYQRGSSHTLLIGDPSTGKSSIMDSIDSISPRSAYESGKNATGAGLTAAAVNDEFGDSQWSLEAGALVKAHNGVACVDEIDKMRSEDLDRLHSALEKESLEINKAGIDTTLKCETSLLAAGNPEDSRFNQYDTDQSQIDVVASLLDRFDLVFTFKDLPDEEKDKQIAESTIQQRSESGLVEKGELDPEDRTAAKPDVDVDIMRAWVAYARKNYDPVIRDQAVIDRIKEYYVSVRSQNANGENTGGEPVPVTVRNLDGLLRLSEASARMRLSENVELIDAEMAIALVKISLQDIGYDPETGKMDVDYARARGSWTQKERRNKIRGIIENIASKEKGAGVENIIDTAEASGIEREKAKHALEKLSKSGDIYQPEADKYRVV